MYKALVIEKETGNGKLLIDIKLGDGDAPAYTIFVAVQTKKYTGSYSDSGKGKWAEPQKPDWWLDKAAWGIRAAFYQAYFQDKEYEAFSKSKQADFTVLRKAEFGKKAWKQF